MKLNLSLYLVTDSTPAILKGRDIYTVVEEALKGGVTIVQYRDKTSDTGDLIKTAKKLHEITKRYDVPLIINDRVDVAVASGADGVHLGQDDMSILDAKKILDEGAIVGISASSVEDAVRAVEEGADYLGIGTVFATPTKTNTKSIIGTAGVKTILDSISRLDRSVGTVAIGGIDHSNVQRVLYQSASQTKELDGVAVVSAIMAADDPKSAAEQFRNLINVPPPFIFGIPRFPRTDVNIYIADVPEVVERAVTAHPIVHSMINFVVANFVANVAIAAGLSPIMSQYGDEAKDLAVHGGGLVINMGTLTSASVTEYLKAINAYNRNGNPVVLDPVGAGATAIRRQAVKTLMAGGYFNLIKGNEREIREVYGNTDNATQRGVDSGPSALDDVEKIILARDLARRERNIVLLTGPTDYLSDGFRVLAVNNGHELLSRATGTGCAIGTVCGAYLAANREGDTLTTVLAGLLMYEIAAENAAAKDTVHGPGTFMPAFLDEIYSINQKALKGDRSWIQGRAKVELIIPE